MITYRVASCYQWVKGTQDNGILFLINACESVFSKRGQLKIFIRKLSFNEMDRLSLLITLCAHA